MSQEKTIRIVSKEEFDSIKTRYKCQGCGIKMVQKKELCRWCTTK